jgi:hypothetical protein
MNMITPISKSAAIPRIPLSWRHILYELPKSGGAAQNGSALRSVGQRRFALFLTLNYS